MRIDELTVEVRDAALERVGQILPADLVGFKAVLRFNNVGSWEISLPHDHAVGSILREPGSGIIVTGPNGVILSGPTTSATNSKTPDDPDGLWLIKGVDDSIILGERLAYPTPTTADVAAQTTANDVRTGVASTIIYEYVDANIGPMAPVEREVPGLAMATDPIVGSTVYGSARFNILGELISGLASVDGLGFDIKQSDGTLEFSVFQPVDRTAYIRMDVKNNTLAKTEYAYGSHGLSRAIVAGKGTSVDRLFVEVTSTESLAAETLWGRRIETFIDERNTEDPNELNQAGVEALAESGTTLTSIDVVPSSDLTMTYGSDWDLGDLVSVDVGGQEVAALVTTVSMTIGEDGVRVGATVGNPIGVDYEALVTKKQTKTASRVNALERKEGGGGTGGAAGLLTQDVKNGAGVAIGMGQAVYISGADGTNVLVGLAKADSEITSSKTLGLASTEIAKNGFGTIVTEGFLAGLDTSAANDGDPVWLSPTQPGGLVYGYSNKPSAPSHLVFIGFVLRANANNGEIYVKVQNGFELDELHDVKITSPAAGQTIVRDATNSFWENGEGSSGITFSDTPPANPKDKDLWVRTTDAVLFVRWNDGNTAQWVELKGTGVDLGLTNRVSTAETNISNLQSSTVNASNLSSGTVNQARLPAGTIIGFNHIRTDSRVQYYGQTNIITQLNINITPKRANSLLVVQWMVTGEAEYNAHWRIYRDGSLIQNTGYQGYNNTDGNVWSGFAQVPYDGDVASTPYSQTIQYVMPAVNTNATTMQLAYCSSEANNKNFFLNRAYGSSGQSAWEVGVSNAIIWEIAQ